MPAPRPAAGVRLPPPHPPQPTERLWQPLPAPQGPARGLKLPARGTARLLGPAQEARPAEANGRRGRAGREESSGLTWLSAGLAEPRRRRRRRLRVPAAHPSAPRHVSVMTSPAPQLRADFPPFFPPPAPRRPAGEGSRAAPRPARPPPAFPPPLPPARRTS